MAVLQTASKLGRKIMIGAPRRALRILRGQETWQMWGRVFDLRRKELVKFDGFSVFVMKNDYIGEMMLRDGSYEKHVTGVLRQLLRPGDIFLDVGANIGYYTMLASRLVGDSGQVIAVEPNHQNLQLIFA